MKRQWHTTRPRDVMRNVLPIYLASIRAQKKQGQVLSRDVKIADLSLLAPDNTELLTQSELNLTNGRRYG